MLRPLYLGVALLLAAAASAVGADPDSSETGEALVGLWTGEVIAPQGETAAIAFDFQREPAGGLGFKLHFPAMFTHGASLGIPVERTGPADYAITPFFAINLHLEGDDLTGTFTSARLPLRLRRGGTPPAPLPRREHPPAPKPVWRYSLGAGTWAPPLVEDGVVYVGGGDGRFHAVDAKQGTALWTWTGANAIDGKAAVDAKSVYFLDTRFMLVALDRATGLPRWRVSLHNEFYAGRSAPDNPTFNHRAAIPLVHDGLIYVGSSDGGMYAIEPTSGTKLWRHDAGAPIYSGIGARDLNTLMFGTMDGSVVLFDLESRDEVRRVRTGGGVVTTPVIVGDRLVVGSRDYQLHAFNLRDGSPDWRFSYWFSWIESTPAIRDGLLYVGGSDYARVSAIDPETGRARWSTIVQGMAWGTPLLTERNVFIGTVNQNVPGTLIEHVAGLVKLDRRDGSVVWQLVLPKAPEGQFAGYAGSLALADDKVIAAGFDGFLTAFPAE